MGKPLCKMTLKDLIDQLQDIDPGEKDQPAPEATGSLENPMKGWISLEDAAFFFNTDVDTLRTKNSGKSIPGSIEKLPAYFRSPDLIQ
jgi:hypothetical protein